MVHLEAAAVDGWAPELLTTEQADDDFSIIDDFSNLLETNLSSKQVKQIIEKFEELGLSGWAVKGISKNLEEFFTSAGTDRHTGRVRSIEKNISYITHFMEAERKVILNIAVLIFVRLNIVRYSGMSSAPYTTQATRIHAGENAYKQAQCWRLACLCFCQHVCESLALCIVR